MQNKYVSGHNHRGLTKLKNPDINLGGKPIGWKASEETKKRNRRAAIRRQNISLSENQVEERAEKLELLQNSPLHFANAVVVL